MKESYTYPALFSFEEDGTVTFEFPDLDGAFGEADSFSEAVESAQDVLAMTLLDYEETCRDIPSPAADIPCDQNEKSVFINVWMPYHRSRVKEVYVKKTLTIPSWLNMLAQQNNLNFSAILVEGLKQHLHLK